MSVSRRNFLCNTGWLTASALGIPALSWAQDKPASKAKTTPQRIIHLVSDGTSWGTITCGDYLSRVLRGRGLAWLQLTQHPEAAIALMNMRSLNSPVTDSAAASSSWGSGSRVVNGTLNVLPTGKELTPLYDLFKDAGWKRGLVTTTEITHATPAGFSTRCPKREDAESIAAQYLKNNVDVLLGGGARYFKAQHRKDKQDLLQEYRNHGYTVCENAAELEAASLSNKWLGVFAPYHLPFTVDHLQNETDRKNVPPLAIMTQHALAHLGRSEHFILQVEGGRVDHGAHANDAAATLRDLIAFDEAVEVCLNYQKKNPETLIVVTVDHGTANLGLNGMGSNYKESGALFTNLAKVKTSFSELSKKLGDTPTPAIIQAALAETMEIKVSDKRAALLASFYEKKGQTLFDSMNSPSQQMGQLLANYTGIGWTSGSHTADFVPLTAIGPGAELFRGHIQNTDVFCHYTDMAGIDFRNPSSPIISGIMPDSGTGLELAEECIPSIETVPHWV